MTTVDVLAELADRLVTERYSLCRLDEYYRTGTNGGLAVPKNARNELREIIDSGVTNWLRLVVETTAERLIVEGFRLSDQTDPSSELWDWWQANRLDGRQMPLYVEVEKSGYSYVSVWPGQGEGAPPVITPESPFGVFVSYEDDDPFTPSAAVKVRGSMAWLYTPAFVVSFEHDRAAGRFAPTGAVENPLGEVPFVKFRANGTLDGGHASELDVAIPIQDRINRTTVDRLIAAHFSAFRQRYATGLVIDVDEDGKPIAPFNAAADRLWIADDPEVKFGEFGEATLSNYIGAVEADVHHLAAVTRTPPHYLLGQMVNLSAEALVAAETGLARKVAERQQVHGESWEDVMRLAAKAAGRDELAGDVKLETVWRRTETISEAQVVDAAVKLKSLGVPDEALWERVGATPQVITRWKRLATAAALREALRAPLANRGAAAPEPANAPEPATEAPIGADS
jgi:hypothetical protein